MASPSHGVDSGIISTRRRFERNLYQEGNTRVMMRILLLLIGQQGAKEKVQVVGVKSQPYNQRRTRVRISILLFIRQDTMLHGV